MKLIDFKVNKRGFQIDYNPRGTKKCSDDKYTIYFLDNKEKLQIICLREDECILLSAILNFAVHKKLVEINKVGCN